MPVSVVARLRAVVVLLFAVFPLLHLSAMTRTWTGTNSAAWSDGGNWGGTAPLSGDDLVFPAGALHSSTSNDFSAGMSFHSITVSGGGYTLSGNAIVLGAGGLSVAVPATSINVPVTLGAAQTWATTTAGATFSDSASLNGFTLTFDIAGGTDTMAGVISGSGAIVKNNSGTLQFTAANTYSGTTTINAGTLVALDPSALGVADGTPANGTIVNDGGSLENGTALGNEYVTATGTGQSAGGAIRDHCSGAIFGGPLVLSGSIVSMTNCGGTFTLAGPVSGAVSNINVFGDVTFTNPGNTFSGLLQVQGSIVVGATNAIPSGVTVSAYQLALNGFDDEIGGNLGGIVYLGVRTLSIHPTHPIVVGGRFEGAGAVRLSGAQTVYMDVANPAPVTLIDDGARLILSGVVQWWSGDVVIKAGSTAFFTHSLVSGTTTVNSGAQLVGGYPYAPGALSAGVSNIGSLALMPGSAFQVFAVGTAAGMFTQLNVTGTVALGNATLHYTPPAPFPVGTQFVIINNDGTDSVSGTFSGLPEGATFDANGQLYRISYAGGTGNDVVLTALQQVTATVINSSPNPASAGTGVTFTATVRATGGVPVPGGTVSFFDGLTFLGSATADGSGRATLTTTSLAIGTHNITAVRALDASFGNSTSAVLVQAVVADVPALDARALVILLLVLAAAGALHLRR